MADRDPQDTEILKVISTGDGNGIDPQKLIDALLENYDTASVIEALQRAIERGKISLNSEGMVISLKPEYLHAA